jgi:hypothetical protein
MIFSENRLLLFRIMPRPPLDTKLVKEMQICRRAASCAKRRLAAIKAARRALYNGRFTA